MARMRKESAMIALHRRSRSLSLAQKLQVVVSCPLPTAAGDVSATPVAPRLAAALPWRDGDGLLPGHQAAHRADHLLGLAQQLLPGFFGGGGRTEEK